MAKSMNVVRQLCYLIALCVVIGLGSVSIDRAHAGWMSTPKTGPMEPQTVSSRSLHQPGQTQSWQPMTHEEQEMALGYILSSPMGIAALNQLAIERFISPTCCKTFYVDEQTDGFQTLLRVKCPDERGVSIATGYSEMRVIFNRFEDNIESFEIKRVYPGQPVMPSLPE